MKISTFRAASLQEALQQIRAVLGKDASVLEMREVQPSTGESRGSETVFEVDATADAAVQSRFDQKWLTSTNRELQPSSNPTDSRSVVAKNDNSESPCILPLPTARDSKLAIADSGHQLISELQDDMIEHGFDAQVADQLLTSVCEECGEHKSETATQLRAFLAQKIGQQLVTGGAVSPVASSQQIVALVGPTGVGKTTTLAKIAAELGALGASSIGLISIDTVRHGAVDQLLNFAEHIAASLEVISSPEEAQPALARLKKCSVVLIDTAGRSTADKEQLKQLASLMQVIHPTVTYLVLSATSSHRCASKALTAFSAVHPSHLIISKLDESADLASWFSLLVNAKRPVSYVTNGQCITQDLIAPDEQLLANMLLGNRRCMQSD